MEGVVTLASTGFGGCGLGTRDTLGEQAISRGRPHTRLNFEVDIFTELLGVMDRDINRLGRDILILKLVMVKYDCKVP